MGGGAIGETLNSVVISLSEKLRNFRSSPL